MTPLGIFFRYFWRFQKFQVNFGSTFKAKHFWTIFLESYFLELKNENTLKHSKQAAISD